MSLGALLSEEEKLSRAREVDCLDRHRLRVVTVEDLVVMKAFARRDRDLADLSGILARQEGRPDLRYVHRWLAELLELSGRSDELDWLKQFLARRRRSR